MNVPAKAGNFQKSLNEMMRSDATTWKMMEKILIRIKNDLTIWWRHLRNFSFGFGTMEWKKLSCCTLRNLKSEGSLLIGVNQGGNASGFLFRKYMADLSNYLKSQFGITIGNTILAHILWADDLILISDTLNGIKRQLNGLKQFCDKNGSQTDMCLGCAL